MNVSSWLQNSPLDHLDSELILAHILGKDRTFLHAHPDFELSEADLAQINAFAARCALGEPLAYILGFKEFYGRNFKVTHDTLVPRPETEALIEVIKGIKPHKILDVGTGSGCIAVTLALELLDSEVDAVDISLQALAVARENAENLGAKVDFYQSNLLTKIDGQYDLIVANLPYVDANWDWLGPELAFEPQTALYAEDGGLALIKQLIEQAPAHLKQHGHLILEADRSQHQKIASYAGNLFNRIDNPNDQSLAVSLCLR